MADAARLRQLARETLAEMGFQVVVEPLTLRRSDGYVFGLWNLSARVAGKALEVWPVIVGEHFRTVVAVADSPEPPVAMDEHLVARLMSADAVAELRPGPDSYITEVAPGLVRVLCVDSPRTVRVLADASIEHLRPLAVAIDLGLRNLVRMLKTEPVDLETVTTDRGSFHLASGESVFIASFALCLPDALAAWQPGADLSRGVIFAAAACTALAFRVVSDARSIVEALGVMPLYAAEAYRTLAGSISPNLYLWEDRGRVTQLSRISDGGITVNPGPLARYLRGPSE